MNVFKVTQKVVAFFALALIVLVALITLRTCDYNPPEGYTKKHHTYDEIVAFAKSVDPNATVSENYIDTALPDEMNQKFREWDAVINGIPCHVSSVGDFVWDATGEFCKQYYVIDTDYDYFLMEKILSEKQPDWQMEYTSISSRYNCNNVISIQTSYTEKRELSTEELEAVWADAYEIYQEYISYPIRKKPYFSMTAPGLFVDIANGGATFVKFSSTIIHDFSDEGKAAFFEDYKKGWELLKSDAPVEE